MDLDLRVSLSLDFLLSGADGRVTPKAGAQAFQQRSVARRQLDSNGILVPVHTSIRQQEPKVVAVHDIQAIGEPVLGERSLFQQAADRARLAVPLDTLPVPGAAPLDLCDMGAAIRMTALLTVVGSN